LAFSKSSCRFQPLDDFLKLGVGFIAGELRRARAFVTAAAIFGEQLAHVGFASAVEDAVAE
jgi:hypothetical protein